jgi:uncharacterized protein YndB with AHSA1/START domain
MQTIASNDPLGADSDIFVEHALQRALADSGPIHQIVDRLDVALLQDALYNPSHSVDRRITPFRDARAEEGVGGFNLLALFPGGEQNNFQGAYLFPKNAFCWNDAIGELRSSVFQKGTKSTRLEFDPEYLRLAFEHARELLGLHPGDDRTCGLEDHMNIRMRQTLGNIRLTAAEIPSDHPIVSDPKCQIIGRAPARMPHLAGRQMFPQHAPSLADFGIVKLFDFGCRLLSRFSNHGCHVLVIFSFSDKPEDKTMPELLIRKSIEVDAPVEILWKVLTDSEFIKQYMFGCNAETNWTPGSPLLWKGAADGKLYVKGHIVTFEKPHRLAYTIFDPNSTIQDIPENYLTMTYELTRRNQHSSALEITQGDFSAVEDGPRRYQHSLQGDDSVLTGIKNLAESQAQATSRS